MIENLIGEKEGEASLKLMYYRGFERLCPQTPI